MPMSQKFPIHGLTAGFHPPFLIPFLIKTYSCDRLTSVFGKNIIRVKNIIKVNLILCYIIT